MHLDTLPSLVLCGGNASGSPVKTVFRLDLGMLEWETMRDLAAPRQRHACCTVRGSLVALGGYCEIRDRSIEVCGEMLTMTLRERQKIVDLPPLSCGRSAGAQAVAVEESESTAGRLLLLGGVVEGGSVSSTVHLVDLATGVCTPHSHLLNARHLFAAARLPDGSVVCAGGHDNMDIAMASAEVLRPPQQGKSDAAWKELPSMLTVRAGCAGCVLSDGRFAVLGGRDEYEYLYSCEAIAVGDVNEGWKEMPSMHSARAWFACAAVAGCIIVVGGTDIIVPGAYANSGDGTPSAEVFDEGLNQWFRLPYDLTGNYLAPVDPLAVYAVARGFYGELAHACSAELEAAYRTCKVEAAGVPYEVDEEQAARRCLAAYALWCLGVLCHGGAEASELAPAAKDAANVTEKVAALDALGRHPTAQMPREVAVDAFLERWKVDNTVICTYLSLMASIVHCQSPLELVKNTIRWNPTRSAA